MCRLQATVELAVTILSGLDPALEEQVPSNLPTGVDVPWRKMFSMKEKLSHKP